MSNQIFIIAPYWHMGTWVFDDPAVGLVREPFVSGIPEMIDVFIMDIPNAREGFRLLFSAGPFPGYQEKLTLVREEHDGNWYRSESQDREGWLCPALFKYFVEAPEELYVKPETVENR